MNYIIIYGRFICDSKEQTEKAKKFVEFWKAKRYEKGESQKFWLSL